MILHTYSIRFADGTCVDEQAPSLAEAVAAYVRREQPLSAPIVVVDITSTKELAAAHPNTLTVLGLFGVKH